jgi:magnesium chelatase family protein
VRLKDVRGGAGEGSCTVASRIARAREVQRERGGRLNAHLGTTAVRIHCPLDSSGRLLMDRAIEKLGLSLREVASLLKVARTIADLAGRDSIRAADLAEAVQYKSEATDSLRPSLPGRPVPSRAFGGDLREAGES